MSFETSGSSPPGDPPASSQLRDVSSVRKSGQSKRGSRQPRQPYAALDLGTNNCRLLIAEPQRRSFRVIDGFSRIVRLGEGVTNTGRLSDNAIERSIEALKICRAKIANRNVGRARLIATEACRMAENGEEFLHRVEQEAGLKLEIVNQETEAQLAVSGSASLIDRQAEGVLIFDIGGGSTELVWLDLRNSRKRSPLTAHKRIAAWMSVPLGVVRLADTHGGVDVTPESFEAMVQETMAHLAIFGGAEAITEAMNSGANIHLLGTSGTVTTLAGVLLGLQRYDRRRVDGVWLSRADMHRANAELISWPFEQRKANGCIGPERADLVLPGCAILEAILRKWPCDRLRVADRGLREGMLTMLMAEDGVWRQHGNQAGRRRRRGSRGNKPQSSTQSET